jgi:hypothetical protein
MKLLVKKISLIAAVSLTLSLGACSEPKGDTSSQVKVTDVEHSWVKRQAVGNCWLYAMASWAESLHLAATGEEVNLSETYLTYWHWYNQIAFGGTIREISTGGNWWISRDLVLTYGFMYEGELLAHEDREEMSLAQGQAEAAINEALTSGELAKSSARTPERVRAVLDRAFGVNMAEAYRRAHDASELIVGTYSGFVVTLREALNSWQPLSYPRSYRHGDIDMFEQGTRDQLITRALRALNDKQPVVISVFVDFNAFDTEAEMFKHSKGLEAGIGEQGGHMVVLEDYTVDQVSDGQGGYISIGEGEVSDREKEMALRGKLRYLVAKNSWGTGRSGLSNGYTRFDKAYLDQPLPRADGGAASALQTVILPPGY